MNMKSRVKGTKKAVFEKIEREEKKAVRRVKLLLTKTNKKEKQGGNSKLKDWEAAYLFKKVGDQRDKSVILKCLKETLEMRAAFWQVKEAARDNSVIITDDQIKKLLNDKFLPSSILGEIWRRLKADGRTKKARLEFHDFIETKRKLEEEIVLEEI